MVCSWCMPNYFYNEYCKLKISFKNILSAKCLERVQIQSRIEYIHLLVYSSARGTMSNLVPPVSTCSYRTWTECLNTSFSFKNHPQAPPPNQFVTMQFWNRSLCQIWEISFARNFQSAVLWMLDLTFCFLSCLICLYYYYFFVKKGDKPPNIEMLSSS